MKHRTSRPRRGMTLVELLVTLSIASIVMAMLSERRVWKSFAMSLTVR